MRVAGLEDQASAAQREWSSTELGSHLGARAAIRQQPVARYVGRDRGKRHRLRVEHGTQVFELLRQEAGQRRIGRQKHFIRRGLQLVQIGGDHQTEFLKWAEHELLPALRASL